MTDLQQEDQDYDSAADEDFAPDKHHATGNQSNGDSSGDETADESRKRKNEDGLDWDNSGDETTLRKAKKKKRRGNDEDPNFEERDGREGGLIKTRAQRKAEVQERKSIQPVKSSLDVDSLWAKMSAPSKHSETAAVSAGIQNANGTDDPASLRNSKSTESSMEASKLLPQSSKTINTQSSEYITIKRTYKFAGETKTEEKTVLLDSAEARLYLEQQTKTPDAQINTPLKRPKKRSLLSIPVAEGATEGSKLNTLEKSKLDWAGYVDEEGITEELDGHDKAKDEYLGRMDFLGRLGARKEDQMRNYKHG